MIAIPTIETARLRLRAFRDADHEAFAAFLADEEATRFLGGPRDAAAAWRVMATLSGHWQLRGYGPFAIEDKQSSSFVGYCGPWFPHGWTDHEIMWGIVPGAQRQGFASEAAYAARSWAYDTLGWPGAVSHIGTENVASQGVARRLGATGHEMTECADGFRTQVWRHPSAQTLRITRGAA